jgi:hypothetical protein
MSLLGRFVDDKTYEDISPEVFKQELGFALDEALVKKQFEARSDPKKYMDDRLKWLGEGQTAAYNAFIKVRGEMTKAKYPIAQAQAVAKRFADAIYGAWVAETEAIYPVEFIAPALRGEDEMTRAAVRAGAKIEKRA